MSAAHLSRTDADASQPTVEAHCRACGDVHPVGDRPYADAVGTTVCPHCGDTRYTSQSTGDPITKPDAERIADAVRDVHGVGDETQANIIAAFPTYVEFEAADAQTLQQIEGVGRTTAARIIDTR